MAAAAAAAAAASEGGSGTRADRSRNVASVSCMLEAGSLKLVCGAFGTAETVRLGGGTYGKVYKGTYLGEVPVAVKILAADGGGAWAREVKEQARLRSPDVVKVYGVMEVGTDRWIAMELMAGSLQDLVLQPHAPLASACTETRLLWLAQVARGLHFVHASGHIHCDIKPLNLLLTTNEEVSAEARLADFGLATKGAAGTLWSTTHKTVRGTTGTPLYMDPRLFDDKTVVTSTCDVYSFGITAWQMLSGGEVWLPGTLAKAMAAAKPLRDALQEAVVGAAGERPPLRPLHRKQVPEAVISVIQACWAWEETRRPTMQQVFEVLRAYAPAGFKLVDAPSPDAALATDEDPGLDVALPAAGDGRPSADNAQASTVVASCGHHRITATVQLPGGRVASCAWDGNVRVWQVPPADTTGVSVAAWHKLSQFAVGPEPSSLVALPDDRLACCNAGSDGHVSIWDVAADPPARSADTVCGSPAWALCVAGDDTLAIGCDDASIVLQPLGRAFTREPRRLRGHTKAVRALAAVGDVLVSGAEDTKLRLWSLVDDTCLGELTGHTREVRALAAVGSGQVASASVDDTARVWNIVATPGCSTCVAVLRGHGGAVRSIALHPHGSIITGSYDNTCRLWMPAAEEGTAPLAGDAGAGGGAGAPKFRATATYLHVPATNIQTLIVLPTGQVVLGGSDGNMRVWNLPASVTAAAAPAAAAAGES